MEREWVLNKEISLRWFETCWYALGNGSPLTAFHGALLLAETGQ